MKQSTKLLSLVLALVMAFSCMTVIGNAALIKNQIAYDSLDDAALAPEQVADLALDLVDNDLLAGMETIDLSIIGELRLNKIDYIFQDIVKLRGGFVWSIGSGLLKNLGAMDFGPLNKGGNSWGALGIGGNKDPYQRADGDLVIIGQLLEFIGNDNNSEILSRIAYGMGDGGTLNSNGDLNNTAQLNLGLISSFLDLGDIGDMLGDLPGMLTGLVYDMLIYGSYGYDKDLDEIKDAGSTLTKTYPEVDTLDEIANNALLNLLINPQDYSWEGEGEAAVKDWNMDSYILPSLKANVEANGRAAEIAKISPLSNSLFTILDNVAQIAINDLGINALNNNLKKTLMEAVEVDFNEVEDPANLPADVQADFEVSAEDGKETYVNYIAYDRIKESGGSWYYTTMEHEVDKDANGDPILDEDGNETTTRVRKYFKANTASANEFYDLINWKWSFVGTNATPAAGQIQLNYENIKKDYEDSDSVKSIAEGFNDLLYLVYDAALKDTVKADFTAVTGGYVQGSNKNLMTNVNRIAKYLITEFGTLVFGSTSPYAKLTYAEVADMDTVDLIAMIGPGFFKDVMPQLIIPKNADGTFAFHDGVQIYEFGALVIREFITDITPNVDYDAYIFANGDVTSADDRQFKVQGAEQWFNLILNMGMDIAYTYLYNITNFGDTLTYAADNKSVTITKRTDNYFPEKNSTNVYDETRWPAMLDNVIMWAVRYVGGKESSSVLNGFDATTIGKITGTGSASPLNKLSYILNSLLPLGIICGYTTDSYDFDVHQFFTVGVKAFFKDFDLSLIAGLFGRNTLSKYNALDDVSVSTFVLRLANSILKLVFRADILQSTDANSLDAVLQKANLKKTVAYILRNLYKNKDALLLNALPVVGKLIKGWGTEQDYNQPVVQLSRSIDLTNGATTEAVTVNVRNASNGVWRHYIDENGNSQTDNQYKIVLKSVVAYDGISDNVSTTVKPSMSEQTVDYGASGYFTYTATGVGTGGDLVRFKVGYQVLDENGSVLGGKIFYTSAYAWVNYNPTNAGNEETNNSELISTSIYTPQYVPLSNAADHIKGMTTGYMARKSKFCTNKQTGKLTNKSGTVEGLNFASVSYEFPNEDLTFSGIRNFDSYTAKGTDGDGNESGSITVSGSSALNVAKTSGSKTSFSVDMTDKDGTDNHTFNIIYFDDIYQNKLTSLASNEMDALRLAADYNLGGKVYANGLLSTAATPDDPATEDDEFEPAETAFSTTAWIATADAGKWAGSYTKAGGSTVTRTVTEYAESSVKDIAYSKDAKGNVTGATGTVTVGDDDISVMKVTVIDCATAINNYTAAFEPGIRGGMQALNANSVYNFKDLYTAFETASNDIGYCKKDTEQTIDEGNGDNVSADVTALKAKLDAAEAATTDYRNYTDYKMWRLNRFNDAREDAQYYVNLQNDASNATVAEIDEDFPYTWINEDDLRKLVADNTDLTAFNGGVNESGVAENFILALLEMKSEEEIEETEKWLADKKVEFAAQKLIDVQMASNYLTLTQGRLRAKFDQVYDQYLVAEIDSINNMIGDVYDDAVASQYTERSWTKFMTAYEAALAVFDDDNLYTQKKIFEAKWELMCCRNELVLVEDEADYTELEALIAQAKHAINNQNLYDNSADDFGKVLAELGLYDKTTGERLEVTNADGDPVDLFPGSALYVNSEPYAEDEQEAIDQAATELKEALARLKFKGLDIGATEGKDVIIDTGILVPEDEKTEEIELVTAKIANIAAEMNADAVKALFDVKANNATVGADNITVSNDLHYTVDTDLDGFAGTNSVVTFYTVNSGIKIPVATVRLVVNGDINGDGAVDVLDGAYGILVANEKAELEGCYLLAGDLYDVGDRVVDVNDYGQIVLEILGKTAA